MYVCSLVIRCEIIGRVNERQEGRKRNWQSRQLFASFCGRHGTFWPFKRTLRSDFLFVFLFVFIKVPSSSLRGSIHGMKDERVSLSITEEEVGR